MFVSLMTRAMFYVIYLYSQFFLDQITYFSLPSSTPLSYLPQVYTFVLDGTLNHLALLIFLNRPIHDTWSIPQRGSLFITLNAISFWHIFKKQNKNLFLLSLSKHTRREQPQCKNIVRGLKFCNCIKYSSMVRSYSSIVIYMNRNNSACEDY